MPMSDLAAIRALIDAYFAAYAAHDAEGCGKVYARDATCVTPWQPILRGAAEIAAAHVEWFKEGETNKVIHIDRIEAAGGIASCLLRFRAEVPADGDDPEYVYGASLSTLGRQPDGNWKISCTSLNMLESGDWED